MKPVFVVDEKHIGREYSESLTDALVLRDVHQAKRNILLRSESSDSSHQCGIVRTLMSEVEELQVSFQTISLWHEDAAVFMFAVSGEALGRVILPAGEADLPTSW